jgi:hypothetical protein
VIQATFRPIDSWPGARTSHPRQSQFKASWQRTLDLLDLELSKLQAGQIVIQLALREDQIRLDGWPRSGTHPEHPGVILAFNSRYGPLKYATDTFTEYPDNLRAIALGLESLRRVDRYGITKRGEQYTGWRELSAGDSDLEQRGHELIAAHGGSTAALKATHPDLGGDPDDFRAVQAARTAQ